MNSELNDTLRSAMAELDPEFKVLRAATGALKQATRLASEEKSDALAMQKAQVKLEQAAELLQNDAFRKAVSAFGKETQHALEALAFDFARDLKELFEQRGETVEGRPPRMIVNDLVLEIDITSRRAQWLYGKETLTKPIPLSFNPILKAYDAQKRAILDRSTNIGEFLAELHGVWQQLIDKRLQRPQGGRISIIEAYSQMVLDRQNARFWNAPSRATFKDYARPLFVRDIVLARANPKIEIEGEEKRLRLAVASKAQAESAARSIWIPNGPLDGEYYASITFDAE